MSSKLSIEAIEVIDAITRKGSFAAAANTLHKVPSAITYTIRKLEEDLNITLFDRTGHRAILTEAGKELLKEGRIILNAAYALETRVQRIANGVETDICIAINDLFSETPIFEILQRFYAEKFGTRIKLSREVFGGSWDALLNGRADISIGASGEAPSGSNCAIKLIGHVDFVFAVAPQHPLAKITRPLTNEDIIQYRAIAAADSSRNLPPRTAGILSGQDVLTVADMRTKLAAQIAGLGVGYLPLALAKPHIASGKLVTKALFDGTRPEAPFYIAWKSNTKSSMGKSQQWLLKAFEALTLEKLLV